MVQLSSQLCPSHARLSVMKEEAGGEVAFVAQDPYGATRDLRAGGAVPAAEPESQATEDRLRHLESLTDATLAPLSFDDLLVELLDRVRDMIGADTAAVLLLDESLQYLVATAARGIEEEVYQGVRVPVGQGFAGRVVADERPVVIEQVDDTTVFNPILFQKGIRTLLGVPLVTSDGVLGVLHVGTLGDRRFTAEDADLLQRAAQHVALAARAGLNKAERTAARALQRSYLPSRLPAVAGLDLAARYIPGELIGVGGDWYDVFPLPFGGTAIAIGDVMGHGLSAALAMSRLRGALRAYSLEQPDPAAVLSRLDRNFQHFEDAELATVLYGYLEPSLVRLHLSSAGHLAPVLARPGEQAALLAISPDPPLGVATSTQRISVPIDVPLASVLLFYTDGLVERPTVPLGARLERLTRSVVPGRAEAVCMAVARELIDKDPPRDDVAMLAVRRLGMD